MLTTSRILFRARPRGDVGLLVVTVKPGWWSQISPWDSGVLTAGLLMVQTSGSLSQIIVDVSFPFSSEGFSRPEEVTVFSI